MLTTMTVRRSLLDEDDEKEADVKAASIRLASTRTAAKRKGSFPAQGAPALRSRGAFDEYKALMGKKVHVPRSWTTRDNDCQLVVTRHRLAGREGGPTEDQVQSECAGGEVQGR